MLQAATVNSNPTPLVLAYTRIRDRIVIDRALKTKLEGMVGAVTLVARQIEHEAGIDLILPGRSIVIIADVYHAGGRTLDVSGPPATGGLAGRNGIRGFASRSVKVPGSSGGQGADGHVGANGGSITILAQRLGDVRLLANGGPGGAGGTGGTGGDGGAGRSDSQQFDGFDGSAGGSGGAAGNGAAGGKGGRIDVEFTAAGVPPPLEMQVAGGAAGGAGKGGKGGNAGRPFDGAPKGTDGANGRAGATGQSGSTRTEPISIRDFWKHAVTLLAATRTQAWADYRYGVGVYFYRQYKPRSQALSNRLALATTEFESVLHLAPGHAGAARCSRQIELGQNVLGMPFDLDLDPRFDEYLPRYASFAAFVQGIYGQGLAQLLAGESQSLAALQNALDAGRIASEVAFVAIDLAAADAGVKAADETVASVTTRLQALGERIRVESAKKPDDSISIGTILTTVGAVAAAVGSVIAAVPTAGASLVALVPSLAALTSQLTTIGGHIFEATKAEKDLVEAKYKAVGKNFESVVQGVKSVISLTEAINKLSSKTASNGAVVELMRQGVELSHELLVARLHLEQAALTQAARKTQLAGSNDLAQLAAEQKRRLDNGEAVLVQAGRTAIRATQRKIDAILAVSFQAQRSLEIYTLVDQSDAVAFDTGFIHPDIEAGFDESEIGIPRLVAAYGGSFLPILDPLGMQTAFDNYFASSAQVELVGQTNVFSVNDAESLRAFKTSQDGSRRIGFLVGFEALPLGELEMKIEHVRVALVGASALKPALDVTVRHGGIYLSRGRNGEQVQQVLSDHIVQTNPQFVSFQAQQPPAGPGPQGHERARTDHLWGRGIGGHWFISIDDEEAAANGFDPSGITEVQLWVETQAFVRK